MEEEILNYIECNRDNMAKNDFDSFFESNEYNSIKDEDSKRIIFYMTTFLMSTKEYNDFEEIIQYFTKITGAINENDYLQKTHECYEELICNYLKKIRTLLTKDDIYDNQNENKFIQNLNHFVDELDNIFYPPNLKLNAIINDWKNIYNELLFNKDKIKKDIKRFERYTKHLSEHIKSLEGKKEMEINKNNINNEDFNIIYNSSIYNNNSLNNFEINKNNDEEDEKEEIEQLKKKQEAVDKVITNEMIPYYFSNDNQYLKEEKYNNKNVINEDKNRINNEKIKNSGPNKENHKKSSQKNNNNKDFQNQNLNNAFQNYYGPIPPNNPNKNFLPFIQPILVFNNPNCIYQPIPFLNNMQYNMNNNYINNKK